MIKNGALDIYRGRTCDAPLQEPQPAKYDQILRPLTCLAAFVGICAALRLADRHKEQLTIRTSVNSITACKQEVV